MTYSAGFRWQEIPVNYTADLRRRLDRHHISLGMLAREMETDRSQVSRWFNTAMQPSIESIRKIEKAVASLRLRGPRPIKRK